jgi:hypothetical protein
MDVEELGISKKSRFCFADYYFLNQLGNKAGERDGGRIGTLAGGIRTKLCKDDFAFVS